MSSMLPPAVRAFVAQASRIPGSFADVFRETRQVFGLRAQRARGVKISRRGELLIETNSQSLAYLAAFFLSQAPPIIGWLPVFVALQYPRQLLTSHFHTPEQVDAFLAAEYKERAEMSLELRDHILRRCGGTRALVPITPRRRKRRRSLASLAPTTPPSPLSRTLITPLPSSSYAPIHPSLFLAGGPLEQMSALSAKHSKLLSGATALHKGNVLMQRLVPAPLERRMLANLAAAIMRDDGCLRAEGLGDLTTRETQHALVRRGFNPWPAQAATQDIKNVNDVDDVRDAATAAAAADALAAAVAADGHVALSSWLMIYDSLTPIAIQGGQVPFYRGKAKPIATQGNQESVGGKGEHRIRPPCAFFHGNAFLGGFLRVQAPWICALKKPGF